MRNGIEMTEKIAELEKAKKNVSWLLDNPSGLADMHGIVHWAGVIERLRQEIQASL